MQRLEGRSRVSRGWKTFVHLEGSYSINCLYRKKKQNTAGGCDRPKRRASGPNAEGRVCSVGREEHRDGRVFPIAACGIG